MRYEFTEIPATTDDVADTHDGDDPSGGYSAEDWAPTFRDPQAAFQRAIDAGALSTDPDAADYVGEYMYMYSPDDGRDAFKHIETREYIFVVLA